MPFIRVNCPKGALTAEQKTALAPRLVHALIRQEIDPVTEIGTAATGFFFNELDVENCFPGGVPLSEHPDKMFWTVEAFVAASSSARRAAMKCNETSQQHSLTHSVTTARCCNAKTSGYRRPISCDCM